MSSWLMPALLRLSTVFSLKILTQIQNILPDLGPVAPFPRSLPSASVWLGLSLTLASDSPRCLVTNHAFSDTTTPHLLPHFSDLPLLEGIGIAHRVQSKRARLCRCNIMVLTIHGIRGELPHVVICNVAEGQTGTRSAGLTCWSLSVSQREQLGDPWPLLPTWTCPLFVVLQAFCAAVLQSLGKASWPSFSGKLPRLLLQQHDAPSPAMTNATSELPWDCRSFT